MQTWLVCLIAIGSNQSGLWTQTGTWQGGSLPTISDQVTINTGHTVTIPNGQTVTAGTLFDQGTLQNFGTLQMGTLVGNVSETLQSVDYSYHIRGGLRGINLDASGNLSTTNGILFSMKLEYENDGNYFDGNIRKQEWKSSIDNLTRSYTYSYDGANRILSGTYTGGKPNENYALNSVSYDGNGNIVSLSRNGYKSNNTFGLVDNLSYNYPNGSNKIQAVTDISGETASFTDVAGSTDYTYYPDGSLKSDANKGIALIEYNYLKLPKKYTFLNGSTLENQYDATGKKLKSVSSDGTIYDFVGNIIYKNNVLYQISHDEGRIINGEYEYEIKDYLGNLRVSFRDSLGVAKITQKQDYDVYGSELQGLSYTKPLWNQDNFKFLGRESIAQTGYVDLMNRQYDKILGRFTSPDPVTDGQESQSLFQYGWNNPVLKSDPNGKYPSLGELLQRAKNYVVNRIVQTTTDVAVATVNAVKQKAKDIIKNTDVALYGKAEVKLTMGAGGAAEIKGTGVDARYHHVELLSGGTEFDSKKGGNIGGNYAGKNGEIKESSGASAELTVGGGYTKEVNKNSSGVVSTKSEIDGGGVYGAVPTPLGPLPLGAGVKLSKETTATGNTYEVRGEGLRTGAKIGTPFTVSFDVNFGIRATYTPKKDE